VDRDLKSIQEARECIRAGRKAAAVFAAFDQATVNRVVEGMARAAQKAAGELARLAVEETGFGVVEDKIEKNLFAARNVYEYAKDLKTCDVIAEDTARGVTEIASPVGLIAGVTPSTNPTSTIIYKALISLKARNAVVFSPHPAAVRCSVEAARVLAPLSRQGLPERYRSQLNTALEEYRQAQLVTADRPEAHLNLGLLAQAVGKTSAAEAAYRTALRLDPAFAPAYANLADLYRALDRDEQGEQVLREGLAAAPDDPALHHALGLLLVREKRLPEAVGELARAAELEPDNPRYAYVRALALQGVGQPKKALAVLEAAQHRHPTNRDLLVALATMNRDAGDRETALGYARKLAELNPDDADAATLLSELTGG